MSNETAPSGVAQMYSRETDTMLGVLLLLMSVFGLCGNGFVIYVLAKKLQKRINYLTTLVLFQLALTDFIGVIPSSFIGYCLLYGRDLPASDSSSILVIRNIIGWLGNVMPLASIYLVAILSFGRCIAIYRSFDYPIVMSQRNTTIMCAAGWIAAVGVACMPYYGRYHYEYDPNVCFMFVSLSRTFPNFSRVSLNVLYILINLVLVLIPAFFMIACCFAVVIRLRRKARKCRSKEGKDEAVSHAATTVLMITVWFIVCYGPYFLMTTSNFLVRAKLIRDKHWMMNTLGLQGYVYLTILAHFVFVALNSCINPCIYYLRAKKFRNDVAVVLREKMMSFTTSLSRMSSMRSLQRQGSAFSRAGSNKYPLSPLHRRDQSRWSTIQYKTLNGERSLNGGALMRHGSLNGKRGVMRQSSLRQGSISMSPILRRQGSLARSPHLGSLGGSPGMVRNGGARRSVLNPRPESLHPGILRQATVAEHLL